MLDFAYRTPGDVQEYCDALWQVTSEGDEITDRTLNEALSRIFARESDTFSSFTKRLTNLQLRVLRTLAKLGGEHPLSTDFMKEVGATNTASVKRALTALCASDLIYRHDGEYKFVSPFFGAWVRRR